MVDLRAVELLGLVSLDLHGVGKDALGDEWLGLEVDVLHLFEALEPAFFAYSVEVVDKLCADCFAAALLLVTALDSPFFCEFSNEFLVWHCDGNDEALSGLSMDEYLCQFVALHVCVFHFFSSDVLPLLQFEDVLLAVYQSDCFCLGVDCSHIAGLQPAIFGYGFFGLCLIVIVAHEDAWSAYP